jgi:hypothetical protein
MADKSEGGRLMTDPRPLDPLISHLRAHIDELHRLEAGGAEPEVTELKRLIVRLQNQVAHAVRDLVDDTKTSSV